MDTLKDMLRSKKFLALLAALIVWAVSFLGLDLEMGKVLPVLGTIAAYIVGQGVADHGKEAVKQQVMRDAALAKLGVLGGDTKKKPPKKR